ncbi:MAG: hypothetical protein ACMX3H_04730 [Sodalis sp. (in: enterobacteria)]|uniref:hypothetical protein n=1 Tax=Sodalis sp. (in: enterobacteria) TaxID=1898979 RepID=UPI0039E5FC9A
MEHILTGPYNKPTNNSRRPPRGAYGETLSAQARQRRLLRSITGACTGRHGIMTPFPVPGAKRE